MSSHDHSSMTASPTVNVDLAIHYAQSYWFIVAGSVGFLALVRGANALIARQRLQACRNRSVKHPGRPGSLITETWATATAVHREICNGQAYVPIRYFSWATPPPSGRVLLLLTYWAVVLYMMLSKGAITHDVFFWERIGYRNAWTTAMQLPLIYLLASKANIIGYIVGTSHERLNWLHRWVARTMFVTATVHGFHFWSEWVLADFVQIQLKSMAMVKYGLGAWGILLWTVITSFYPIRHWKYEVFVAQHIASVVILPWVVYVHVPKEARWVVWFSVAAFAWDRFVRWMDLLRHNLRFVPNVTLTRSAHSLMPRPQVSFPKRGRCSGNRTLGHQVTLTPVGGSTLLTIKDVHFSWRAGQHLYLWLPRVGPLEAHPYTISSTHRTQGQCCCNSIQLMIRTHNGFSRRLYEFARKAREQHGRDVDATAFVSGPYGRPPRVDIYETLVLISASTGASFTMPILEGIVHGDPGCTRRVEFVLLSKKGEEIKMYVDRIRDIIAEFREKGIQLGVHIAITNRRSDTFSSTNTTSSSSSTTPLSTLHRTSTPERDPGTPGKTPNSKPDIEKTGGADIEASASGCCSHSLPALSGLDTVIEYDCRPDLERLVREPVEKAYGETAVVVCGGTALTSRIRNLVVRLSDGRAVHKGTGAQGIALFVEEYAF